MSAAPCDRKTWNKDKELWKDCSSEVVLTLRLLWFIVLFIHIAGFPVCCLTHNSSLLQDEPGRDCKLRTPFNATLQYFQVLTMSKSLGYIFLDHSRYSVAQRVIFLIQHSVLFRQCCCGVNMFETFVTKPKHFGIKNVYYLCTTWNFQLVMKQ